ALEMQMAARTSPAATLHFTRTRLSEPLSAAPPPDGLDRRERVHGGLHSGDKKALQQLLLCKPAAQAADRRPEGAIPQRCDPHLRPWTSLVAVQSRLRRRSVLQRSLAGTGAGRVADQLDQIVAGIGRAAANAGQDI